MTIMPPPQYDHPPVIPVIEHVLTYQEVTAACPKAPPGFAVYGCAWMRKDRCDLFIMEPRFYVDGQAQYDKTHRHEIAHCNGWPPDHPMAAPEPPVTPRVRTIKVVPTPESLVPLPSGWGVK